MAGFVEGRGALEVGVGGRGREVGARISTGLRAAFAAGGGDVSPLKYESSDKLPGTIFSEQSLAPAQRAIPRFWYWRLSGLGRDAL